MEKKTFQFQFRNAEFHSVIQSYVSAEPHMPSGSDTNLGPVYTVSGRNALHWLRALKELWRRLESCLSTETSQAMKMTELMVKDTFSSIQTISDITTTMFVLEALMPVLKHIVSSRAAARALAQAGKLKDPSTQLFQLCSYVFQNLISIPPHIPQSLLDIAVLWNKITPPIITIRWS